MNVYLFTLLLSLMGWWGGKAIWGKPLNINYFYTRAMLSFVLDGPELLSQLGVLDNTLLDFHSDDLTDASPEHDRKMLRKIKRNLEILNRYDRERQTEDQLLSTDILAWFLNDIAEQERFLYYDYPLNQMFGVQSQLPSFMDNAHQIKNRKSARNYISRLSKFDTKFDQVLEGLRLREEMGIIPPRFVIEKVLAEMRAFVDQPPRENILYTSFVEKMEKAERFKERDEAAVSTQVAQEIERTVYPAYGTLINYYEGLLEKATDDDGVWKLPDGDAFYASQLRSLTTTDYTPEEVHRIGLREVEKIQGRMLVNLDSLGYRGKTVAEHMLDLADEERFLYADTDEDRQQILEDFRAILNEIDANLNPVFDVRPQASVEVRRVPEFKEKTSAGAYYNPPSLDGSRPGRFYVNQRDVKEIPKFTMRSLAYHEGIPGHHFQIALAMEQKDLPIHRRLLPFTAFVEGWALYAERLAWEYGFQDDPYDNLGRLQAELFRAVRLVVDTGLHYKRWTREQAITYMLENTGFPEGDVVAEVERYIVMPGQACAYKIGMFKMLELREKARQALGDRFDIREFHNVLLTSGAMPLGILERVVDGYIQDTLES